MLRYPLVVLNVSHPIEMDEQASSTSNTSSLGNSHRYTPFSDYKLTCRKKTFEVHKVILHLNSDFFKKALSGDFREGQAETKSMPLLDDTPEMVHAMLEHFYWHDYTVPSPGPTLTFQAKLLLMADKYGCSQLFEAVLPRLQSDLDGTCLPEQFADMARIVADQPSIKLTTRVMKLAIPALRIRLSTQAVLLGSPCIKQLLGDLPEWSLELLKVINQAAPMARQCSTLVRYQYGSGGGRQGGH